MIGIIGIGFVGSAIQKSLNSKNINITCYDKYKEYDSLKDVLKM